MGKGPFHCAKTGFQLGCARSLDNREPAIHNNVDMKLVEMGQIFADEDMLRHQVFPIALSLAEING